MNVTKISLSLSLLFMLFGIFSVFGEDFSCSGDTSSCDCTKFFRCVPQTKIKDIYPYGYFCIHPRNDHLTYAPFIIAADSMSELDTQLNTDIGIRTFSTKYGGCSLSYLNKEVSANFKYTEDIEPNCKDYKSDGQVNKFKCYCDDGTDDFDFSTNVKITYQLIGGKCPESSTSPSCKQIENIKIGTTEGYSIINKINEFENLVSNRDSQIGIANFDLKISAEITDDKCSQNEKNNGKLTPKVVKELSNTPKKEIEKKEPRLAVLASILHKVAHFENAGEARTLLSNALFRSDILKIRTWNKCKKGDLHYAICQRAVYHRRKWSARQRGARN